MAASTVDTSAPDVWRRPAISHRSAAVVLATGLLGYLVSGTGTWLAVRQRPWDVDYGFRRWDGAHYLTIAVRGYPSAAMPRHGPVPPSNWAFFPGYPLAMRAVHLVGVPWHASAWLVNGGSGLLAFWVVALLMRTWYDERVAVRTAQALAVFPGACLLVFAYAEGLFLLLAATCLLAVRQRRWPAAGLACCAAGGVRSQGAFLALLLGVVAVLEVRRRRELRALLAPALAPWGFVGFLLFAWRSTGRPDAWYAAQRWGWGQRDDFQAELWRMLTGPRPFSNYQVLATVFGAGCLLLVVAMGIVSRRGIPRLLVGYTLAMLLPLLANSRLGLRPRFLLPAFPLMALPARALHRWTFVAYCVLSSAGLLWAAYWFAGYVPP